MFFLIIPIPVQLHRNGPISVPSCWSLLCFIKFYFIMMFLVLFHLVAPCSFLSYCFLFCLIMFVIVLLYLIGSCSVPSCAPLPSVKSCWLLFSCIMLVLVLFYKVAYKSCPVQSCCSLFCYIMCYAINICKVYLSNISDMSVCYYNYILLYQIKECR